MRLRQLQKDGSASAFATYQGLPATDNEECHKAEEQDKQDEQDEQDKQDKKKRWGKREV